MTVKLAFDVEEATARYASAMSPEYQKLAKFAEAKGAAAGSTKAGLLKRSVTRFVSSVKDSASTLAVRASAVRDELRDPIYKHVPSDLAQDAASHLRSIGFRTRMRSEQISMEAKRIAASMQLSKFFEPGSRTASAGRPRIFLPAVLAVAAIGIATASASLVMMDTKVAHAAETSVQAASIEPSEQVFHPIEMRSSKVGFAALHDVELPGAEFMEAALASLTDTFGSADAAQAHLDLTIGAFKVCIAKSTPCSVHTAGIDLDPVKQRYIVSTMDEEGYYGYSAMEYYGEFVPLAGQDGTEPVDNPYSYKP